MIEKQPNGSVALLKYAPIFSSAILCDVPAIILGASSCSFLF